MRFTLECTQEADGRWLGEVPQLPGVIAYGASEIEALGKVQILALRVLADQLEAEGGAPADVSLRLAGSPDAPLPLPDDAASYNAWLAAEVQEAIDDDGPALSTDEVMRQVRAAVFRT